MVKSRPVGVVFVIFGCVGNAVSRVMLNCILMDAWKQRTWCLSWVIEMFGIHRTTVKCPECGSLLDVSHLGSQTRCERCPGCGADLMFETSGRCARVSVGFQRSGMHGPVLSANGFLDG